jgi:ABC-type glycerol-3-phosphate transport system substrate-binding protein
MGNNLDGLQNKKDDALLSGVNMSDLNLEDNPQVSADASVSDAQDQTLGLQNVGLKSFGRKGLLPKALLSVGIAALVVSMLLTFFLASKKRNEQNSLFGVEGQLVWWGISDRADVVNPIIEEYQRINPNVKISYVQQSEKDYRERLMNALAQGKGPDIFEIHNSWVPMFRGQLSVAPSDVMSVEEFKSVFYPVAFADFVDGGGVVGLPLEYDSLVLFYNQDLFESALMKPPKTWDQVSAVATMLTQKGVNNIILQSGISLGLTENVDYWQDIIALLSLQNGGDLARPGKEVATAVKFFVGFGKNLGVWNSSLPNSVEAFANQKLAMLIAPTRIIRDLSQRKLDFRIAASQIPQLPKNSASDPDLTYASYWAYGVWNRSRNSNEAWKFLKFLSEDRNLMQANNARKEKLGFEKIYPKKTMSVLQKEDKVFGAALIHAGSAASWYLADKTFDGKTGINSLIGDIYKELIESAIGGKDVEKSVLGMDKRISTVLANYFPRQ